MNRTAAACAALTVTVGAIAFAVPAQGATPQTLKAYTTAYDYWDNTPPGSAEISHPVLHSKAGGKGTYADPLTLAVGHSLIKGKDVLDVPKGTRFYFPDLRKYALVEDTCGDGKTPQNKPCHRLDTPGNKAPKGASVWVDIWAGGDKGTTVKQADACMSKVTDGNGAVHTIIKNPAAGYVVETRPILQGATCRASFGNTAKRSG